MAFGVARKPNPFAWAENISDDDWIRALATGRHDSHSLPACPPNDVQERYVGSSGEAAFREAATFWRHVSSALAKGGQPVTGKSRVLDFGVGWGRFYRYLLRELRADQITGYDVAPEAIDICRKAFPDGDFHLIDPMPPYSADRSNFDLIYVYSIFSHLSEGRFLTILAALRRILAPKGCIAFTTLRTLHIDVWASEIDTPYMGEALRKADFNREEWWEAARRGDRALYCPIGGGPVLPAHYYGLTVLPEGYLRRIAGLFGFEMLEFLENGEMPQALVVLRKAD